MITMGKNGNFTKRGRLESKTQRNDFRYAVNFAIIAKIQGIEKFKFSLCTVIFSMIANFRYDSEISLA